MAYTYPMDHLLPAIFLTLAIAAVLSIILKRFGISHIIGYIMTGTIISCLFSFNGLNIDTLAANTSLPPQSGFLVECLQIFFSIM